MHGRWLTFLFTTSVWFPVWFGSGFNEGQWVRHPDNSNVVCGGVMNTLSQLISGSLNEVVSMMQVSWCIWSYQDHPCSNMLNVVRTNCLNNQANGQTQSIFNRKLSGDRTLSRALLGCQELLVGDTCGFVLGYQDSLLKSIRVPADNSLSLTSFYMNKDHVCLWVVQLWSLFSVTGASHDLIPPPLSWSSLALIIDY